LKDLKYIFYIIGSIIGIVGMTYIFRADPGVGRHQFHSKTNPKVNSANSATESLDEMDEIEREVYGEVQRTFTLINATYESSVKPIFVKKCYNCHSTIGKFPWYYEIPGVKQVIDRDIKEALSHLDMTGGFPFDGHGSVEDDLKAIENSLRKETMPPLKYLVAHWDHSISEDEKTTVIKWINKTRGILDEQD
jgi:hypothetical protein